MGATLPLRTMPEPATAEGGYLLGASHLVRLAFEQRDTSAIWNGLVQRVTADPLDAAALMDISVMLQAAGKRDRGLLAQDAALQIAKCFRRRHGRGDGLKVLAFMAPGDFMANTPIDFLLEGSDMELISVYVDAATQTLPDLPGHDVAFVAVGESEANEPVLRNLQRLLAGWKGAILNNAPQNIQALTRDGVAAAFANEPAVLAPVTVRVERNALSLLAQGKITVSLLLPGQDFPVIVRPVGTHAGQGMEKIDGEAALLSYLAGHDDGLFYVCPFINYRSPDGLYRKQRIAFIDGKAFASHFAASGHWMVHYLSAGMVGNAARCAEEAQWMSHFDDFAGRHGEAFAALHRLAGLDYFVIDCAEMPDGRLLLFEVDVAMIVHDMDPADLFPYKKPAMKRLFEAFQGALEARSNTTGRQAGEASRRPPHFLFRQPLNMLAG